MRKTRIELLLIGLVVVALSAGVVAGVLASRLPAVNPGAAAPAGPGEMTPLAQELGLTADQQEKMKEIWEGVRERVHSTFDDAQRLQRERDDTLIALLNEDQKARFEKISKDFAARYEELSRERENTFKEAVERTKKLLNDQQRKKYDELLKSRALTRPGGGPPFPPPGPMTRPNG